MPMRSRNPLASSPWAVWSIGAVLTLGALLTSLPFIWMLLTSVRPMRETVSVPPDLVPDQWTFDSYRRLFRELAFGRYLTNTLIVVAISFGGMFLSAMAGYGFAKFRFRGKSAMFAMVMATMMIPIQVTMIPTYLILNEVGLTNTLVGIAMPTLVGAFNVFLFRQFMLTIPDDVLEAARLDGAGEMRAFWAVVLPMSRPILAVQAVLTFIAGWNSFLWPLIIGNEQERYTLSVGISLLNQQQTINPPLQMAGASLMVVPIVVIFVLFQRRITQGFTMSGLK
jgi:multiple sugar transport system permease protein